MNIFLILPNQLFENPNIPSNITHIYLLEEPHYFSTNYIKPNKIKIAYLRACMKYYYSNILKKLKTFIMINEKNIYKNTTNLF